VSILRHLLAILSLPFMVIVVIPLLILSRTGFLTRISVASFIVGLGFIALGLTLMYHTISLFVTVGKGTLAPWMPTERLVVRGIYRHVRNPMITGVLCVLLGEVRLFTSYPLLLWLLCFLLLNMIYIPFFEEPGLERRFGDDYKLYKENVPRWIPRLTAWTPPFDQN
jgi:protein-S-isoprenylcysteine O-methyltransferase Ste14